MPTYEIRVAAMGCFEDVKIDAPTVEEACAIAMDKARNFDIVCVEPFDYDKHDLYIDAVSTEKPPHSHDVPREYWHWKEKEIATLEEEIKRLKIKCGELY